MDEWWRRRGGVGSRTLAAAVVGTLLVGTPQAAGGFEDALESDLASTAAPPTASAAAAPRPSAPPDSARTEFGGGVYLFRYQPLDLPEVDGRTEVYALYLQVDHADGPWAFRVQGRWRDTKLRSFYPSNVWIQEAWVSYTLSPGGGADGSGTGSSAGGPAGSRPAEVTLRAGKLYTRLGRFWDSSFFGNVHYFDGLKLDPDFGAEAAARVPAGRATLELRGQFLTNGDRVNGAFAGRDLEGIEGFREEGSFAGGARLTAPVADGTGAGSAPAAVSVGVSGLLERIESTDGRRPPVRASLDHVAVDAEVEVRGHRLYAEWSRRAADGVPADRRAGPAGSDADYWLLGAQVGLGRVHLRYNYSRGSYDDAGTAERIHQPGITVDLAPGIHALVEYDDWTRGATAGRSDGRPPGTEPARIDRSLDLVLLATF